MVENSIVLYYALYFNDPDDYKYGVDGTYMTEEESDK